MLFVAIKIVLAYKNLIYSYKNCFSMVLDLIVSFVILAKKIYRYTTVFFEALQMKFNPLIILDGQFGVQKIYVLSF